ncbi:MAG: S41 family peptidase, partial [Ignavibacteriaceae bacterium]
LYDCDALIIDLRNNGGGLKSTGWIIASAFIDKNIIYFYQQEKTGRGHNDFGEPIPLMISPRKGVLTYTKKISLLTNRFSASGSEHFAQLFKFLPYTTQIGDTTFGCFGDIIGNSELLNGWVFWYPIRLTKAPDGFCPEGIGIIPDVLIENTSSDIKAGRDNVIQAAINYLSE